MAWSGDFAVELRDRTVSPSTGQCCVVPAGAGHRATSRGGADAVLFTQAG